MTYFLVPKVLMLGGQICLELSVNVTGTDYHSWAYHAHKAIGLSLWFSIHFLTT